MLGGRRLCRKSCVSHNQCETKHSAYGFWKTAQQQGGHKDIKLTFQTVSLYFSLYTPITNFDGAVIVDNCERELAQQQCWLFM